MGRSSGGGGGGRSGGGFRGSRSSGGFSGSSSRGYSSSSRPHYHPRPNSSWVVINNRPYSTSSGGGYRNENGNNNSGSNGKGCMTIILVVIAVFVALTMLLICIGLLTNENTTERTPLSGVVNKTEWYQDDIGWVKNKSVLIEGLEYFYNETGIQPYVVLTEYSPEFWKDGEIIPDTADKYLSDIYDKKFTDEGHFIFAYFQCKNDSLSEMEGEFRYVSGFAADSIMDNEALTIFWGNFEDNYYDTSLSMEEMISDCFVDTADTIMSTPTNGWDVIKFLAVPMIILAVAFFAYKGYQLKAKREREKEEYTKKILSTPLETFGEDTSELEEKYK